MNASRRLIGSFRRPIECLRISLTERCDLHCVYCRPARGEFCGQDSLTRDDVVAIARAAARLGLRRIRLTGGEPLLRDDLEEIVRRLREIRGLADLALTTNGQRLAGRAAGLAAAGLMRVNVSLDSLNPRLYAALTGGGRLAAVRSGLEAALAAGLSPVKVNAVLASPAACGPAAVRAFAELIAHQPVHVRFIEAMPACSHLGYLPAQRVLDQFARYGQLTPVAGPEGGGPARYYQLNGFPGTVGLITPISQSFCSQCNRLRITARGELKPCLFSPGGLPLLPALRSADPIAKIMALLRKAARAKPARYGDLGGLASIPAMHVIGG